MAKKKNSAPASVEAIRHKDTRANIPTEELRDFVADQEQSPKTLLYPRDPSIDPQLVWRGKDEQDRADLAVHVVPIYIQEKIHPQAIIHDLLGQSRAASPAERQMSLFADFNGIEEFDKKVEFYQHEQHWSNRMILGDSLLVMASLAEKEGLKGKVQMIYFDPPYGIKFGSNWQVSTRKRDVKDGNLQDATRQPEQIRAFRDTWRDGIHSYLTYLRDRLTVARDLLSDSGSIFVQIGDENVHRVRAVMDEVFGDDNHLATICFQKTGSTDQALLPQTVDYLLVFAKSIGIVKYRQLYLERSRGTLALERYDTILEPDGTTRPITREEAALNEIGGSGVRSQLTSLSSARPAGEGDLREFKFNGVTYTPGAGTFKTDLGGLRHLSLAGRARPAGRTLRYLRRVDDFPVVPVNDRWESVQLGTGLTYVVQTSSKVVERCILMATDPGDLVLDPTCGSGTTATVAEQWGRRWITIDTSRVALALARTRIMGARYPFYMLADSREGQIKEAEVTRSAPSSQPVQENIRQGFVYERVPHITLKSIANNAEIDAIWDQWQTKLEPLREKLNAAIKKTWQEWEIPREADAHWHDAAKKLHADWWQARIARQQEIDKSIAAKAEHELLYDKPYQDTSRIRVSGPFTVESLSPHRILPSDDERPETETEAARETASGFVPMILENLKKAGVQNTVKQERLKFDQLDPFGGTCIHAVGSYTEADGKSRRVAVSVGPEFGTVGPELVKEAAKEAVQGIGFDLLVVCGFAFDPHVNEESKRYGKLPVLIARMNPDLAMGDELLKKTGSGNLFMVFGEPDITIEKGKDGTLTVELLGVDVYDPTTGQIRNSSTDDIACWFIDTAYDGESFFVRHAYFTGADEPYEKLKRALRAEVDEDAWASLYSTKSRPFPRPRSGKIAIKVINHYGDEVLKVVAV